MKRSLLFAAFMAVLPHAAIAQATAEKCFTDDQAWTPPVGLTTVKRVVVVGGGAAGGADNAGSFGMGGQTAPNGGATGGTGWGAGGGAGIGGGGGQAGAIIDQSNVTVSGPVSVEVGDRGTTAGANGTQSCFGATCAAGGVGGGAFNDFSPVSGGQAGWGGTNGTGTKTSPTQEFGNVYTGLTSSTKTITVVNNSGASSTFQSITAPSNVNISSDNCSAKVIAKSASCTFNVSMSPSSTGTITRTIPVNTDRGILNVAVRVTGEAPPSCSLPWGGTVAHGGSVTAYASASVAYGGSCTSQTRTCSYGTLSGSYSNASCTVQPGASCNLPWGGSISSEQSVTAYASSSVAYGSSCTAQTRTCTNGSLSGSYTNRTCTVESPAACALPWGGYVAHGSSVTAYQSSSVTSPATCSAQSRTCNNGSLSGSYANSSCSVTVPSGTWVQTSRTMDYTCWGSAGSSSGSAKSGACSPIGATNSYRRMEVNPGCYSAIPYSEVNYTQTCQ